MPIQTLSISNSHPPLIPFTNPLKTSSLFIFKTHHNPTNKTHICCRKLTVFAVKEEEEQPTPSWAKPGSEEPPPWARNEAQQSSSSSFELPFFVYLLSSAITAIAAIGSVFEYVNQKPVFGLLNSDSVFYAPVLGFFAITGLPTAIRFYCLQNRGSGASLMAKAGSKSHVPSLYSLALVQFNDSGGMKDDKNLRAGVALCARADECRTNR